MAELPSTNDPGPSTSPPWWRHDDVGWWVDFVQQAPPRTAKLAVVLPSGAPLVAPVWIDLDHTAEGHDVVFTTGADTGKGRGLLHEPRVSLAIDDDRPPFTFVVLHGTASVSQDPDELLHWATRLGGRYMGAAQAEAYGRRNATPGELLVRVQVHQVVAVRDVAT